MHGVTHQVCVEKEARLEGEHHCQSERLGVGWCGRGVERNKKKQRMIACLGSQCYRLGLHQSNYHIDIEH